MRIPQKANDPNFLLDLLQKCVLESGFEFHVTDGSNQIEA